MELEQNTADIRLLDRTVGAAPSKHPVHTCIIEAEMVAYNERTGKIDEFWRISNLKNGINTNSSQDPHTEESTQTSHESLPHKKRKLAQQAGQEKRHFKLVFFDLLELNGTSYIRSSCQQRLGSS